MQTSNIRHSIGVYQATFTLNAVNNLNVKVIYDEVSTSFRATGRSQVDS